MSIVYMTKEITPESLVRIYHALGISLPGSVAVKISTGEPGGRNFLQPELIRNLVQELKGTIVECNTAYEGRRNTSKDHWETMRDHGFTAIAPCDILDEEDHMPLPVTGGFHLTENYVGSHLQSYDSMLMLSHFKGHAMGGFGGALKNMSIGLASSYGKIWIHSSGTSTRFEDVFTADHDSFLESMADAAKSVVDFFHGNAVYVNVMMNMSVDCDCCAVAEDPCMKDIGILVSEDPIAIDQACIDLVYAATDDPGQKHFLERVESRNGVHTIEAAAALGFGSREYELVEVK